MKLVANATAAGSAPVAAAKLDGLFVLPRLHQLRDFVHESGGCHRGCGQGGEEIEKQHHAEDAQRRHRPVDPRAEHEQRGERRHGTVAGTSRGGSVGRHGPRRPRQRGEGEAGHQRPAPVTNRLVSLAPKHGDVFPVSVDN